MSRVKFLALLSVFSFTLAAQYPTPIPGIPGTVPEPSPTGNQGSMPGVSRSKHGKKNKKTEEQPVITAEGLTRFNDGKKLVVKVADGRTLTMAVDQDTKWTRSGADIDVSKVGVKTTVRVDAAEADNYDLTVRHVELLKDAPEESAAMAAAQAAGTKAAAQDDDAELTRPTILHAPDAPGRPILRRETPKTAKEQTQTVEVADTKKSDGEVDFTIDSNTPAKQKHSFGSELLDKTTDWAESFTQGLPNYVCEQNTARYAKQSQGDDWQPQDVLSAKVVHEDGRDSYRDIQVNGKATNKSMLELGGQTSTGEFGGLMASLFEPIRNTDFQYERASAVGDTEVAIYDFKVPLASSDWNIFMGGQMLQPAYSGKIYVNKRTGEILHFEQHADNIPKDFPNDVVETTVDYEPVSIGTAKYFLPVHSENLSCLRGTQMCGKNTIDFRNYHKYAGESTIIFH